MRVATINSFSLFKMTMKYDYFPAPGKANILADIEEQLELLNDIFEKYEPTERPRPSVQSVMSKIVGSYGYTYDEYQYGCYMA